MSQNNYFYFIIIFYYVFHKKKKKNNNNIPMTLTKLFISFRRLKSILIVV